MITFTDLVTQTKRVSELKYGKGAGPARDLVMLAADSLLRSPSAPYRDLSEIPFVRKFYVQEKISSAGLEPGQIKHWITTNQVDRVGEVMEPKGAYLKFYKQNPLVLWSHSPGEPENIIGLNKTLTIEENGISAITEFDMAEAKAARIYGLYQREVLKGWSVGFIPLKGHTPKEEGGKRVTINVEYERDMNQVRFVHDKWMLLEYSCVGLPCNPGALTMVVAKELNLDDETIEAVSGRSWEIAMKAKDQAPSGVKFFDMGGFGENEAEEKVGEEEAKGTGEAKTSETGAPGSGECAGCTMTQEELDAAYEKADPFEVIITKPLTGQHACVIKPLADFEAGSIRTMKAEHEGKPYSILIGKLKGKTKTTTHSFHYPMDKWTSAEAKKHCGDKGGTFEAGVKNVDFERVVVELKGLEVPIQTYEQMEEAAVKELIAGYLKNFREVFAEMKVGRTLSKKTRTLMTTAVTQLKESKTAALAAIAALEDLLNTADKPEGDDGEDEGKGLILDPDEDVVLEIKEEPETAIQEAVLEIKEEDPPAPSVTVEEIAAQVDVEGILKELIDKHKGKV